MAKWFAGGKQGPANRPTGAMFRGSLVRTVMISLLALWLLPFLILGAANYFRSRNILENQAYQQIATASTRQAQQIRGYVQTREEALTRLVDQAEFTQAVQTLLTSAQGSSSAASAQAYLQQATQSDTQIAIASYFDMLWLVGADGSVLYASDVPFVVENFGSLQINDPDLTALLGSNTSQFLFNPATGFYQTLALFSTRSFIGADGQPAATLVGIATNTFPYQVLTDAAIFLPEMGSYFFTPSATIIGPGDWGKIRLVYGGLDLTQSLSGIINNKNAEIRFLPRTFAGQQVIGYAQWISEYNLGILQTYPLAAVNAQSKPFDTFNLALIGFSILLFGAVVYFGSTQLVNPLVKLARTVEQFSRGNWGARAQVQRQDEIGLLAYSFNRMADELSGEYRSLEAEVEKRTSQLRIAAEVGQSATLPEHALAAGQNAFLAQTVAQIADRFGFYHVALYLADAIVSGLALHAAAGSASAERQQRGERYTIDTSSLPGSAAYLRAACVKTVLDPEAPYSADALLPETRALLCVPLAVGYDLFGVLEIHSTSDQTFDPETVIILQSLANQISGTLQTTRVLQANQISYQEMSLLAQGTRKAIQAGSAIEIIQALVDTLRQSPYLSLLWRVEDNHLRMQLIPNEKYSASDPSFGNLTLPTGKGPQMLSERGLIILDDLQKPTGFDPLLTLLRQQGCASAAVIGIFAGQEQLHSILVLGSREPNQISPASIQPYTNLAEIVSASLEKFQVQTILQTRLNELQVMASFSQALSAETDLHNMFAALHQQVTQTIGAGLEFAVALFDHQTNIISFPYFVEQGNILSIAPFPLGEGLTSVLLQERKPLLLPDERAIQARSSKIVGRPARSWMGIPLITSGDLVGAVILQDLENEQRFNQDDVDLFLALAPQIATMIRNTQLYSATQQALQAYDLERFLLNSLLANMPEQISFKNTQGVYLRASASLAQQANRTAEEITGQTDHALFEAQIADAIVAADRLVLQSGQAEINRIEKRRLASGTERWEQTSRIPIQLPGETEMGLLVIQSDVTDLKTAEETARQRSDQITIAAEIARDATATLEGSVLLRNAVNLVRERFHFYHASIFLVDRAGEYAVLRESTGTAGEKMLQAGHKLAVSSQSIVGQVTATGKAIIVNDTERNATHLPNPLLPDTRSEMALPLLVGERVLGALDVQSTEVDAFHDEDVSVLQILADQVAVAVVNSTLFAQTQDLLNKHRLLRQITVTASLANTIDDALTALVVGLAEAKMGERVALLLRNPDQSLQVRASAGYENKFHPEARILPGQGIAGCALAENRMIYSEDVRSDPRYMNIDPAVRSEIAIPIQFNDNSIGVLHVGSTRSAAFDVSDQEILLALSNNIGGILSNIQLLQQVQQQVAREQQLFAITSKIRRSVDLQNILETSSKELCNALGARRVRVEITARKPAGTEPEEQGV